MARSAIALMALALGTAASGQKWVPLNSKQSKVMQGQIPPTRPTTAAPVAAPVTPTPAPPQATVVVAPAPGVVAPPPVASQPVTAQTAPTAVPVMATATGTNHPMEITCFGGGTANKAAAATGFSSGSFSGTAGSTWISGSTSGTTTVFGTRQQGFGDQVDIRLFGGDDRIRMPRTMLPGIHGGDHGWFKLKDVVADARSIRASAAVNFINNPKVYIDRVTGTISISGRAGDYAGQCQAIQMDAPAKF